MASGYQGYAGYGSPEQMRAQRARALAESLQQGVQEVRPTNLATLAMGLGQAWLSSDAQRKADAAEADYADTRAKRMAQFFNPSPSPRDAMGNMPGPSADAASSIASMVAPSAPVDNSAAPAEMAAPVQNDRLAKTQAVAKALGGRYQAPAPVADPAASIAQGQTVNAAMPQPAPSGGEQAAPLASQFRPIQRPQDRRAALMDAMRITGGDLQQAMAMVEAKLGPVPAADKYQFLQGPDGSLSVGNLNTGEIDQRVAGAPKPADPIKWDTVTDGAGNMWRVNPYDGTKQPLGLKGKVDGAGGGSTPSGYRWTKDGGLEPIPGGPADKTPGGPMDPDNIKLEREFAKDWKGVQSNYQDIDSQYERMQQMAARGDSAGDLALVVSFTKMLDPGSVAREGEVALTQSAASFLAQAQNWLPRLEKGNTLLPPEVRKDLLDAAREMHGVYSKAYQNIANDYARTASDYGFGKDRVMMGYREPPPRQPTATENLMDTLGKVGRAAFDGLMPDRPKMPSPAQPARPAAAVAQEVVPQGVDPADWKYMTPEQKALFQQ